MPAPPFWRRIALILWLVSAIRVILAEDNYLVREGVRQLLEATEGVELVATCGDLPELEAAIAATDPDVVITDIRMPPTGTDEGLRAAHSLRKEHPAVGVVVLSQYAEPEYALALLEGGSAGRAYLLKERVSDVGQLLTAIKEVAAGGCQARSCGLTFGAAHTKGTRGTRAGGPRSK